MKNLNKFYIFCLLLSVIFVACKKDDDNTSGSVVTLRGKYSYRNNSDFEAFRWGAGGVEIPISELEKNLMISEANMFSEGGYYNFLSNTRMCFVDTVNQLSDTVNYKITGDIVYIDVRHIPIAGIDFYPLFKISGTDLYSNNFSVLYEYPSGSIGTTIQTAENINLVDTVLTENGYTSLSDLKTDEQLTYTRYKKNYKK